MTRARLSLSAYTVAWISALPVESAAAAEMLDQEHDNPHGYDDNIDQYLFGQVGNHNVVMARLPSGRMGNNSSAAVVSRLTTSFPSIRFALMVGIGGGVPSHTTDIRLGDVVIGHPHLQHSGVVQYDFGKTVSGGHMRTGSLDGPPRPGEHLKALSAFDQLPQFRNTSSPDVLFQPAYTHVGGEACEECNEDMIVRRGQKKSHEEVVIHYGTIASGNQVIKDGVARDQLSAELGGVMCFEMEGAGLANTFPCVVVRGICDYADSHKNKVWQPYAAATAAAVTKEMLLLVPIGEGAKNVTIDVLAKSEKYCVPFSLKNIPVGRFADRPKDMEQLERALMPPKEDENCRRKILVLQGLGGAGKTQLAVEFSRKHQGAFTSVFWIDGDTEDSLKQSVADNVGRLPEGQIAEASRKYSSDTSANIDDVVHDFLLWLSASDNQRWLLVLDNVDRDYQRHNDDIYAYDISKYIQNVDHGSILITTRHSSLRQLGEYVHLGNVDILQAQTIFQRWYGQDFDMSDSEELLELLGGLPLALAQAATYLSKTGTSFQTYARLYKEHWKELMEDDDSTPLRVYRDRSINTTWVVSYNAVRKQDESAANLLLLWAHIDNKSLPYWMFQAVSNKLADELSEWFGDTICDEVKFLRILQLLQSYCLVDTKQASTHPVVHEWAYHIQDDYQKASLSRLAILIIGNSVPDISQQDYPQKHRQIFPHAESWVKRRVWTTLESEIDEMMLDSLGHVAYQLFAQGSLLNARLLYERALKICEKNWSLDHYMTISILYQLGSLHRSQMDLTQAEALLQRALDGCKKVMGPDDSLTFGILREIGSIYADRGLLKEAQTMWEQALEGCEMAFGPDDLTTIEVISDIGYLKLLEGKLEEAETMLERGLEGVEKALGPGHMSMLPSMHNLGMVYEAQNKVAEAENMYQRALAGKEEMLGADHISTLSTVNSIATLYINQDKIGEAEMMYQRALEGRRKIFGPEHTKSLSSLSDMAYVYHSQGKLEEAKVMYQHALQGFERVLGPQYVETYLPALNTVFFLGSLYEDENNIPEAKAMYARLLTGYEMIFGKGHEKYQDALRNLQNLEGPQDDLQEVPQEVSRQSHSASSRPLRRMVNKTKIFLKRL